jgi:hypothetical protein
MTINLSGLTSKDKLVLVLVPILFLLLSVIGWHFIHELIFIVDFTLVLFISIFIPLTFYRKYEQRSKQQDQLNTNYYRQLEALFSVFAILQPNSPLPSMRHFSITPDFARTLIDLVMSHRPKLVVETGSGTSTLIISYTFQKLNEGKIISLENNEMFANKHRKRV